MTPPLETLRLTLRQFTLGDWDDINAMLSDPPTTQNMHFGKWTEDQRRQWFDKLVTKVQQPGTDAINWAIARKDVSGVIGWFGIGGEDKRGFGYLLNRSFWNQGYMTEALRAVMAYEFNVLGSSQLSAACSTSNPASSRVMEKAGMHREKTEYGADFEGNWGERHHYIITKAEYDSKG